MLSSCLVKCRKLFFGKVSLQILFFPLLFVGFLPFLESPVLPHSSNSNFAIPFAFLLKLVSIPAIASLMTFQGTDSALLIDTKGLSEAFEFFYLG